MNLPRTNEEKEFTVVTIPDIVDILIVMTGNPFSAAMFFGPVTVRLTAHEMEVAENRNATNPERYDLETAQVDGNVVNQFPVDKLQIGKLSEENTHVLPLKVFPLSFFAGAMEVSPGLFFIKAKIVPAV
jgi:hypothetical protein